MKKIKTKRGSTEKAKSTRAKPKPKKPHAAKRLSGLDAAAKVLADTGKPMRCQEIFAAIRAKRLWTTKGKTPAATIRAAIIREIRDKKAASRIRKVGRGTFATAKPAAS